MYNSKREKKIANNILFPLFFNFIMIHPLLLNGNIQKAQDANIELPTTTNHLQMFQTLFKVKRNEHKEAIKIIKKYDAVKQYKLIETIVTKGLEVMGQSQIKLREFGYVPGMEFPTEEATKEALSLCLENAAFLSEVILHFPTASHRILNLQKSWNLTLTWGVFFASQSKFLDENTKELIFLVSQELGLAEKDDNYINPYMKSKKKVLKNEQMTKQKKSFKKKKSFKQGPTLSRDEL